MMNFTRAASLGFLTALGLSMNLAAQTGTASAMYEVTFEATWSAATHPGAYPPGGHFSALVGATHQAGQHLWQPGGIASSGIELMAEDGATSPLLTEVSAAIAAGLAGAQVLGFAIPSPGLGQVNIVVTDAFPSVSLVTMIAPSPDWFVGVDDLALFQNGAWVDEIIVPLLAWDAGSDDGVAFTSFNADSNPKQPISLITGGPFSGSDPLGTFTFRRKAASVEYGTCANPKGSLSITGFPSIGNSFSIEIHDPGLTMPQPSSALFVISSDPHPNDPCGLPRANWGLSAPGATGELMTLGFFNTLPLPTWSGSPVSRLQSIPNNPALVGLEFYLQGALIAPGTRIGLTSALRLSIGN